MSGVPPIDPSRAFLGVGWAFPLRLTPAGEAATVAYENDVHEALRIILGTRRGERLMRPDFGAGLEDFVFESIDTSTLEAIKQRVTEALVDWEPRIDLLGVAVTPDPPRGRLLLGIDYRIRATNSQYNLVYPFYLQEGEGGA